jgi:amino acid adenylation domain-containing protein
MKCIDEAFREQAALTPDAAALRFGRETLTYQNLSQRAGALAHRLRARGVGPDVLVGLFVERSADMVVAMLGVLMAGGAYVPLDPTYPAKRIAYVLADAKPLVILTHLRLQSALPRHQAQVIIIDDDAPDSHDDMPAKSAAAARSANDLAYVIYTSGSTGEPKGVEIPHRAVTNMLASMQRKPGLTSADTMLAITTLAFDIAVLEIFLPLVCGACVVVAPIETTADGEALASLIEQARISIMQATPATLRMLLEAGWNGVPSLKILCGGEAWPADLASQLLPRCASLWNMYGPTETTVWSAVSQVEPGAQIVIGAPIANTRFYVLNGARELVPVGVPGELYIGGAGLARGYFNRPELTAERFTKDPFVDRPQARIYRTGDLVRRLADGTLEFMGRVDHQVKIRGHRVELGEIEAALQHHDSIGQCVVVAQDDPDGGHRLVAYYISTAGARIAGSELRSLLGESLPAYMVPSAFVPVDAFPLTPNGKLDRKALPPPETAHHAADDEMIAPRTPTEIVLAKIWCDTLHLDRVGIRDNFFDLGGHSLLAVRVIGQINGQLKLGLTVPAFFQNPTIEGLARSVSGESQASAEPQVVTIRSGNTGLPLYFIGARPSEYVLGRMIGGGRTVHAIDVPLPLERLDPGAGSTDRLLTIEEIAALYSDLLFTHAGKTPCVIVGYSLGGKIAFEVARLLQRAGGRVAFILIVDAWAFTWTGATRGPGSKSLAWLCAIRGAKWRMIRPSFARSARSPAMHCGCRNGSWRAYPSWWRTGFTPSEIRVIGKRVRPATSTGTAYRSINP